MDKTGGHYTKREKSDRGRQVLYVFPYVWNLEKLNSLETAECHYQGLEVGELGRCWLKSTHLQLEDE